MISSSELYVYRISIRMMPSLVVNAQEEMDLRSDEVEVVKHLRWFGEPSVRSGRGTRRDIANRRDRRCHAQTLPDPAVGNRYMKLLNRSAVLVMASRPFLEWLHRVNPTSVYLTLEDLRKDPSIYLLQESDDDVAARAHLQDASAEILEEQLEGWYRGHLAVRSQCPRRWVKIISQPG